MPVGQALSGADNVYTIWQGTGTVQTLDESPPEFTTLMVKDRLVLVCPEDEVDKVILQ